MCRNIEKPNATRRRLMQGTASIFGFALCARWALAVGTPPAQATAARNAAAARAFWDQPRILWLSRLATGEQLRVVYWEKGRLQLKGYRQICQLMRDLRINQSVSIDIRLLDILYGCQRWLQMTGVNVALQITSGYRSQASNDQTEGAARQSLHQYGRAADFFVAGVSAEKLATMARYFHGGGVGVYPNQRFIHVDSGRPRIWRGVAKPL